MTREKQPKIAIVTPWNGYHAEWFQHCVQSVKDQTLRVDHVFVFDGVTPPLGSFEGPCERKIVLPSCANVGIGHGDAGNLARGIGGILCAAEGYDAVTYLDADNWIDSTHIERLWNLQQIDGAPIVTARRTMHQLDGRKLYDEQDELAAGHVDTNCMFFHRAAFPLLSLWTEIPRVVAAIGDQFFWKLARAWLKGADVPSLDGEPTVHYRTGYAAHYRACGMDPPAGATKEIDIKTPYRLNFNVTSIGVEL